MESLEDICVESLEGITRLQSTRECSCGGGHVMGKVRWSTGVYGLPQDLHSINTAATHLFSALERSEREGKSQHRFERSESPGRSSKSTSHELLEGYGMRWFFGQKTKEHWKGIPRKEADCEAKLQR